MNGFLDLPYRLPFAKHYAEFDRGFYVDFPRQLRLMGQWLRERGCRKTLDVGAMTGGCIEYITGLGLRMDGVQFTEDVKRLAAIRLRKAGVASTLYVSPVHSPLRLPAGATYDGIVSLSWFNLPFRRARIAEQLRRIRRALRPGGVFLFDFFEFKDVVVEPPDAQRMGENLVYVATSERDGKTLRRHHLWVTSRGELRAETSVLVDRTAAEARSRLGEAGLRVVRTRFLDLNYPRHFWMAERV